MRSLSSLAESMPHFSRPTASHIMPKHSSALLRTIGGAVPDEKSFAQRAAKGG